MSISDNLKSDVENIFETSWDEREGKEIPDTEDVKLKDGAVHFKRATFLYADIDESSKLVENYKWWFAGKVHKAFLSCAAKIIREQGGSIKSYDGDRVMGVFVGDHQTSPAAIAALKINYAVKKIINIKIAAKYPSTDFVLRHVVGIDTGEVRAIRAGVRGHNDLAWIGKPANYAAKLSGLSSDKATQISDRAHFWLDSNVKTASDGRNMWTAHEEPSMDNDTVHYSNWTWKP